MTGLFVFGEDFVSEGPARCAQRIGSLGVNEVALCLSYHSARDLVPHDPVRVVKRHAGLQFATDPGLFEESGLYPAQEDSHSASLLATIREELDRVRVTTSAWCVFLHNEELGERYPDVVHVNCFGDRSAPSDLCPANPRVRLYCGELVRAAAAHGYTRVYAESLHYGWFEHGYHHERDFSSSDAISRFVLGVCFCRHCLSAAADGGADVIAARRDAQQIVSERLLGPDARDQQRVPGDDVTRELIGELSPALRMFCDVRCETVASLVDATGAVARDCGIALMFLDMTGARRGYLGGNPGVGTNVSHAWQIGVDIARVPADIEVVSLAYVREARDVYQDVRDYAVARHGSGSVSVVLRPGSPDCASASNLREKVTAAYEAGASAVSFYCYSLYGMSEVERIRGALGGMETVA